MAHNKLKFINKETSEFSNGKLAVVDHQMQPIINQTSNGSQSSTDSPTRFTQSSVSDVAWDWHSPRTNRNNKHPQKLGEFLHTPKGLRFTQKKRNLNSPPTFKPNKRKLLKEDNAAKPTSFEEELQALSNQIKPGDEQFHKFTEISDIANFDGGIKLNSNKSSVDKMTFGQNGTTINKKGLSQSCTKDDLECLFDDSIDDCMIRCSQEIEEESVRDQQLKCINFCEVTSKYVTSQLFQPSEGTHMSISCGMESTPKEISKTSMLYPENLKPSSDVKQTNIQLKSENSILNSNNMKSLTSTSKRKNSISAIGGLDTNNIPDNFLNESQDFTELQSEINQRATEKSVEVKSCSNKFFRKSSDTNFDYSSGSKESSAVKTMSAISKKASGSSKTLKQRQSVSNESLAVPYNKKQMNNEILLNNEKIYCDRIKVNGDGSSKRSPVTQCTQEEIESKHREAKMKLEAKQKCIKIKL